MKAPEREKRNSLVGKYFHVTENDKIINYQGQVVSAQGAEHFLVQYFSWIDGKPGILRLFHISKMLDWVFYNTAYEMKDVWEQTNEGRKAAWAKGVQL